MSMHKDLMSTLAIGAMLGLFTLGLMESTNVSAKSNKQEHDVMAKVTDKEIVTTVIPNAYGSSRKHVGYKVEYTTYFAGKEYITYEVVNKGEYESLDIGDTINAELEVYEGKKERYSLKRDKDKEIKKGTEKKVR